MNRSTLSAEAKLLEQARRALRYDPAQADPWLEQHRRRYPNGALRQERALLEIRLALALGDRERASQKAERFVRETPNGALSRRALEILKEERDSGEAD